MPKDVISLLNELGLSESETKIYLASLEAGPTSVQDLAKKARLSRTAAYDAVASLQDRGLMTTFDRGKKRFFVAEGPDKAVTFFRSKIRGLRTKLEALEEQIPELKLQMGGDRPAVHFYEGRDALHSLFNDVAQAAPKTFDEVSNMDDVYDKLDIEYLKKVRKLLDPNKIRMRILHHGELRSTRPGVKFCKLLPEFGDFHGDIWIYSNRVAFVQFFGKVTTVILESEAFADTARALFNAAWRICSTMEGLEKK